MVVMVGVGGGVGGGGGGGSLGKSVGAGVAVGEAAVTHTHAPCILSPWQVYRGARKGRGLVVSPKGERRGWASSGLRAVQGDLVAFAECMPTLPAPWLIGGVAAAGRQVAVHCGLFFGSVAASPDPATPFLYLISCCRLLDKISASFGDREGRPWGRLLPPGAASAAAAARSPALHPCLPFHPPASRPHPHPAVFPAVAPQVLAWLGFVNRPLAAPPPASLAAPPSCRQPGLLTSPAQASSVLHSPSANRAPCTLQPPLFGSPGSALGSGLPASPAPPASPFPASSRRHCKHPHAGHKPAPRGECCQQRLREPWSFFRRCLHGKSNWGCGVGGLGLVGARQGQTASCKTETQSGLCQTVSDGWRGQKRSFLLAFPHPPALDSF